MTSSVLHPLGPLPDLPQSTPLILAGLLDIFLLISWIFYFPGSSPTQWPFPPSPSTPSSVGILKIDLWSLDLDLFAFSLYSLGFLFHSFTHCNSHSSLLTKRATHLDAEIPLTCHRHLKLHTLAKEIHFESCIRHCYHCINIQNILTQS